MHIKNRHSVNPPFRGTPIGNASPCQLRVRNDERAKRTDQLPEYFGLLVVRSLIAGIIRRWIVVALYYIASLQYLHTSFKPPDQ